MTVYNSYMRLYKNLSMHAYIRIFSYGYIGSCDFSGFYPAALLD